MKAVESTFWRSRSERSDSEASPVRRSPLTVRRSRRFLSPGSIRQLLNSCLLLRLPLEQYTFFFPRGAYWSRLKV
jgi:hypothetical protein